MANWTQQDIDRIKARQNTQQLQNAARLYSKAVECLKPVNNPPVIPETRVQQAFIKEFAYRWPDIYQSGALFAVPNQGKRSRANASRMKSEGMVRAVSDLILLWPSNGYHGAVIEMKTKGGKVDSEQLNWQAHRRQSGYAAAVCWSAEEAINFCIEYLKK